MDQQLTKDSKRPFPAKHPIWTFAFIAVGVIAVQVAGWWAMSKWIPVREDRSAFGDMFGSINTLFSGLAFAGVICAILMQKHELELQRQELSDTRDELKRSADAQTRSDLALREQAKMMLLTAKIHGFTTVIDANEKAYRLSTQGVGHVGKADDNIKAWVSNLKQLQDIMREVQALQLDLQSSDDRGQK